MTIGRNSLPLNMGNRGRRFPLPLIHSNWNRSSDRWPSITGQMAAMPQPVRIRLLAMTDEYSQNATVALNGLGRRKDGDIAQLALQYSLANPDMTTCVTGSANPKRIAQWAEWASLPITVVRKP